MPQPDEQQPSHFDAGAPPTEPGLSTVVHRNIAALMEVRRREERRRTVSDRIADAVTAFVGSMWCAYLNALLVAGWIVVNVGWVPRVRPFDPFPFVMLAVFESVQTIFLSTFILISQNRMQRMAHRRAELDLQISLLTEHELTRAVQLIDEVARHLGAPRPPEREMQEIKKDINPQRVVEEIAKAEHGRSAAAGAREGV